jgi:hypothetical protein
VRPARTAWRDCCPWDQLDLFGEVQHLAQLAQQVERGGMAQAALINRLGIGIAQRAHAQRGDVSDRVLASPEFEPFEAGFIDCAGFLAQQGLAIGLFPFELFAPVAIDQGAEGGRLGLGADLRGLVPPAFQILTSSLRFSAAAMAALRSLPRLMGFHPARARVALGCQYQLVMPALLVLPTRQGMRICAMSVSP